MKRNPNRVILDNAYASIAGGLRLAARLVAPTIGPAGGVVLHSRNGGTISAAPNAHSILTEIDFSSAENSYVFAVLKEAAIKMRKRAGDGIAGMILLGEAIFAEAVKYCDSYSARSIVSSIAIAKDKIVKSMTGSALHLDPVEAIKAASETAGMDSVLQNLFTPLAQDLKDGAVVLIDDDVGIEPQVIRVTGLQFSRGFASHYFVNDSKAGESVLKDCLILTFEPAVNSVAHLNDLMKALVPLRKPLLIVTSEVSLECISHLIARKQLRQIETCVVKTMSSEKSRRDLLEDIALFCGGKAMLKDMQVSISGAREFLGTAREVRVDRDSTTISGGGGNASELLQKELILRKECSDSSLLPSEVEDIQKRIMRLRGVVIRIRAGAPSTSEIAVQKSRLSAMVAAAGCAIRTGMVPGCGLALLRESAMLSGKSLGGEILSRAARVPFDTIVRNSGFNPHEVLAALRESEVFDCTTGKPSRRILDPLGIVREQIETACSVACMFLDTAVILAQTGKYTHLGISKSTEELLKR